jgi:GNAT superfamily N-acetyltransferase
MDTSYRTRIMTREEMALAVDWAAAEGWNPGLHDAPTFYAADPTGFLVGMLGEEPVASISMVKYGSAFAFLGLYLVRPAFRSSGYGLRLWQDAMAGAHGRQVGLDGVVAQQANYRKSGFALAWRNVRYEGQGRGGAPSAPRLRSLATIPLAEVLAYDRPFFPEERSQFLGAWLGQADASGLGFVEDGRLQGYGLIRRCRTGWKIGPLFADTETIAEALYLALAANAGRGEPIWLDIPEANEAAVALTRRHGMRMVFETARMYTGTPPPVPMHRLYGITTFELG